MSSEPAPLEEEWHQLVGVLPGVPTVPSDLALFAFHGVKAVFRIRVVVRRCLIRTG